jgi:hypothetical protein
MGLKKLAAKVARYNERLDKGQASKIKPDHVEKVARKLRAKESELSAEIAKASDPDKKARLEHKRMIALEQIARAEFLLGEMA